MVHTKGSEYHSFITKILYSLLINIQIRINVFIVTQSNDLHEINDEECSD